MRRLLSDPRLYAAWAVLVIVGLLAAYGADPYLFGLAVFGLGAATGLLCVAGTLLVVVTRGASRPARWTVAASLSLSIVAILTALSVLGRFHWA